MLETPSKALSEGEQQQLRADLNAQDMESLSELAWFTLTIHGGRAATSAGTSYDAARAACWRVASA